MITLTDALELSGLFLFTSANAIVKSAIAYKRKVGCVAISVYCTPTVNLKYEE